MAVIADLDAKGRAFLEALEAARPAIERLKRAAAAGHPTGGVLASLERYELESVIRQRSEAPPDPKRRRKTTAPTK